MPEQALRFGIALLRGFPAELQGIIVLTLSSEAVEIHAAKPALCDHIAMTCGLLIPGQRLSVIPLRAIAGLKHESKVSLRGGIVLLRGLPVPGERLSILLLLVQQIAKEVLRRGVALLRSLATPLFGFRVITLNPAALIVHAAKPCLCVSVFLLCGLEVTAGGI